MDISGGDLSKKRRKPEKEKDSKFAHLKKTTTTKPQLITLLSRLYHPAIF